MTCKQLRARAPKPAAPRPRVVHGAAGRRGCFARGNAANRGVRLRGTGAGGAHVPEAHLVACSSVPLRVVRCAHTCDCGTRRCALPAPEMGVYRPAHKLEDLRFVRASKAAQRALCDAQRAVRRRRQCVYAAAARRAVRCASLGAAVTPGAALARVRCRQRRNTPAGLRGYSQTDQNGCVASWMCAVRGSARRGAACKRRK